MMNRALFTRVDALYRSGSSLGLDAEASRVMELTWKTFVASGAKLCDVEQARLAVINERLAELGTSFSQNVLADEREPALLLKTTGELQGLPD